VIWVIQTAPVGDIKGHSSYLKP